MRLSKNGLQKNSVFSLQSSTAIIQNGKQISLKKFGCRNSFPDEVKQGIYDMWIDDSINSTDGRNGRNFINISKKGF